MNSGISDSDSGQNTKMAGLSQNQCPVYRGMTVRVMPESVSGLLRNMHYLLFYIKSEKIKKPHTDHCWGIKVLFEHGTNEELT